MMLDMMLDKNIYYNPESFGLSIVGMVQDESLSYEFDMFVVWKDKKTGRLYYQMDSGCSCPAPFEDFHSKEELEPIRSINVFGKALERWNKEYRYERYEKVKAEKIDDLEREVARQLRNLARRKKRTRAKLEREII